MILFSLYSLDHNILRLSDICEIFISPQVKRVMIIGNKHGIYELPNELLLLLLLLLLLSLLFFAKKLVFSKRYLQC